MILLPYERFSIVTKLHPQAARRRLTTLVKPSAGWEWFWGTPRSFEGWIKDRDFRLNFASPKYHAVIQGTISRENSGSIIRISMRPRGLYIAFMLLIAGLLGYLALLSLWKILLPAPTHNAAVLVEPSACWAPILMSILAYTLFIVSFKLDSTRARALFCALFEDGTLEDMARSDAIRKTVIVASLALAACLIWMVLARAVVFTLAH